MNVVAASLPAGTVVAFAANSTPTGGFLLCNGANVSRTTYANLFAAIGTLYGTGDGSSTFGLPNLSSAKFVTSNAVSVMGTGKVLGVTDGTNTYGWVHAGHSDGPVDYADINVNVGTAYKGYRNVRQATGVVTDASKSGLKGTISVSAQYKWFIKY